ncbi:hypothetical protein A2276_03530 [candidate division WOR-1 bacterium RIFOXYA12_FULL_43_27]|uniref:Hydrogenase n=1 Tax=candidate division WOR-1 bacterium RIFOXYC2_FULL_46_14 TaxID=1802587 RepID=A0A1F4U7M1_UNCSA|nr:MAG: hypothetical protein A2276_03530 [candidate division WOR-1 bacterium RIFOXYA12_FULL_43_27]OGC19230.1 MAG: hypothetical protein A2292_00805 [candidate division WOR-1 bacterium RIFOXYB2_FULL_46_45]OGC30219.1 MAG: hypothetical protein A2232_00805 [candidate division WOR-1 bacterium RIFOXYA2_FULL_46_56]OGC40820.1 MAG: hypothetical protein A2438_00805 [candidate division WOR-1 bacterium RIFOXYC2_FULL_46_14]
MENFIILGLLLSAFGMVFSKRVGALIWNFTLQSFFLFLLTFIEAVKGGGLSLYLVAVLVLILKVLVIPRIFSKMVVEMKVSEDLGFFIRPELSLIIALLLAYLSWVFSGMLFLGAAAAVAFLMMALGFFIMVFRAKALAQIIGLLAMENGIFLLASLVSGGMSFLVEMAIFFDVFVGAVILGIFVYRINRLFVSIDVSKLNRLRG